MGSVLCVCDWGIPWAVCYVCVTGVYRGGVLCLCDWGIPWAVCYVCVTGVYRGQCVMCV